MGRSTWTEEEVQFLKKNYKKMTYFEISKLLLGKSYASVCIKINRLGLRKQKRIYWSEEEEKFVIENYPKMGVKEIADALGRSKTSVSSKIRELRKKGKIKNRRYPMPKYLRDLTSTTTTPSFSSSS